MLEKVDPDVVTLDLIMPNLDGIGFLKAQIAKRPVRVLVLSIASESSELVIQALELGALDFVQKPTALATEKLYEISRELVGKIKLVSQIPLSKVRINGVQTPEIVPFRPVPSVTKVDVCVIGISTGGPQALKWLICSLPKEFPVPILVVMHMPEGYTDLYAKRVNELSLIEFVESQGREVLRPGMAVLTKAGYHLYIEKDREGNLITRLDKRPLDSLHRPSVDVLFRSAAEVAKDRVLGIVMTGMGSDGTEGAAWIKSQGGTVLAQSKESCLVYGMPGSVV